MLNLIVIAFFIFSCANCQNSTLNYEELKINSFVTGIWGVSGYLNTPIFLPIEYNFNKLNSIVTFSYSEARSPNGCQTPHHIQSGISVIPERFRPTNSSNAVYSVPTENLGNLNIGVMVIDGTGTISWYTNGSNDWECTTSTNTSGLYLTSVSWNTNF